MTNNTQTAEQTPTISDVVMIPWHQLQLSKKNVRTIIGKSKADKQFAENIRINGVLQNLIVTPSEDKKKPYDVDAGGRRWAAVGSLVADGLFAEDYPMPCRIQTAGSAVATSLAENAYQRAMHPLDQFTAIEKLLNDGMTETDIGAHFGMTQTEIQQRLKLGQVHPKILKAYAKDEINLETVMAFTLADTKKQQLAVFKEVGEGRCWPAQVKRAITNGGTASDHPTAKYVTLKAYRKAGGSVIADLFEERSYLVDRELLDQLALDKLNASAERLKRSEGWANVEAVDDINNIIHRMHRVEPEPVGVPKALTEKLDKAIEERDDMDFGEDWTEEMENKYEALCDIIAGLEDQQDTYRKFSDADKETAICYVTIGHNGKTRIERAFLKRKPASKASQTDSGESGEAAAPAMPQALTADLGLIRQQIAKTTLATNPTLASDVLLYTMAVSILEPFAYASKAIDVSFRTVSAHGDKAKMIAEGKAGTRYETIQGRLFADWLSIESPAERFAAFRKLTLKRKEAITAFCVAQTLSVELAKDGKDDCVVEAVLNDLAPDYAADWRPNAEDFFQRVTIGHMMDLGLEFFGDEWVEAHKTDKKKDLVDWFDAFFKSTGDKDLTDAQKEIRANWLPPGFESS